MKVRKPVVCKAKHEDVELDVTIGTLRKEPGTVRHYYSVSVNDETFEVYGMMSTEGICRFGNADEYHRRQRTIERDLAKIAEKAAQFYFNKFILPVREECERERKHEEFRRALYERDNWTLEITHDATFQRDVAKIQPLPALGLCLGKEASDPEEYRALFAVMRLVAAAPKMAKALLMAQKMIEQAHAQFNWGASALDNESIQLLNEAPKAISEALKAAAIQGV